MIKAPESLSATLRGDWDSLAPVLEAMGTLREVNAEALARYLTLNWEYTATSSPMLKAILDGDIDAVERWAAVQDKLHKQIVTLAVQFGLTAESRQKNGWVLPGKTDGISPTLRGSSPFRGQ